MKTKLWPSCTLGLLSAMLLTGCFNADVRAPDNISIGGSDVYSSPPPAQIAPAAPNDLVDLHRENQQLRQRMDYLDSQNRRLARKYDNQADEIREIRADMDKIAAERDRYRRALGRP